MVSVSITGVMEVTSKVILRKDCETAMEFGKKIKESPINTRAST